MKLVKAFGYGICSFALASAAWAGGDKHDKSSQSSTYGEPSISSSESSASSSADMSSDASAAGGSSGASNEPELLGSEQSASEQYGAMDDSYWSQPGFSSSDEISLGS